MEYAYATLLLNESDEQINEKNLTAVLEATGCAVEESRVKAIVAALEGVDLDEVGATDIGGETTDRAGDRRTDRHDDREVSISGSENVVSDDEDIDPISDDEEVDVLNEDTNAETSETPPDDESVVEK